MFLTVMVKQYGMFMKLPELSRFFSQRILSFKSKYIPIVLIFLSSGLYYTWQYKQIYILWESDVWWVIISKKMTRDLREEAH